MEEIKFKETEIGEIPEEWEDGDLFVKVINHFLEKEEFILSKDLNERTIIHKLAEHLQSAFKHYNVDCEYNRMKSGKINREYIAKELDLDVEKLDSDDAEGKTVYPDIIIHKRGKNNDNYIVIEVKKKKFANQIKMGLSYKEWDYRKLRAYISQLQYRYGIYLELDGNEISELKFFDK